MGAAVTGRGSATKLVAGGSGDVLLLSMRRVAQLVAYCIEYEFEDIVGEVTGADRLEAGDETLLEYSRRVYKYTRFLSGSRRAARQLSSPMRPTVRLRRDYELFFPVFNHIHELPALNAIPDWRKRSRLAACFVSEIWIHKAPKYLLEMLADFDHVFVGVNHSLDHIARVVKRPCSYLPLAADVLRFAPPPELPEPTIDVCNIGRRSQTTHEALLRLARDPRFFYYYDTVAASGVDLKQRTFRVQDPREHRMLLASILKRSRFYIANRGFVNDPGHSKGFDEISARFYEGAAAGAVMIGVPPETEEFKRQFDWPDVLTRVPFDCANIGQVLQELGSDPQRLLRIRRHNVYNAALRHDWVHRLRTVYETLGMTPTEPMLAREARLQALATQTMDVLRVDSTRGVRVEPARSQA